MIKKRKDIPLESFRIIIEPPENRFFTTCVNIYDDGKFNMNGKLSGILGGKELQVSLTDNCRNMCLKETDEKIRLIKFPKCGSRRLFNLIYILKDHGISLPAKYEFWYSKNTGSWQGEYVENPTQKPLVKPRSSKKN